jgi:hypothetical protein
MDQFFVLSNAPELQMYWNYSYKTFEGIPDHPVHSLIMEAEQDQLVYQQTDMNQEASSELKQIRDKYILSISFMNKIATLKKNMMDRKYRL